MRQATKEEDISKLFNVLLFLTLKIILDSLIYPILLNFLDLFLVRYLFFYALFFLMQELHWQVLLDKEKQKATVEREVDGGIETICLDLPAVIT